MKENKSQFNFRVNKEEVRIIDELRDKHAINLSGAFKLFLKQMLERLNKSLENDTDLQN
jgi:hypothetical protein